MLRRHVLYPAELRAHNYKKFKKAKLKIETYGFTRPSRKLSGRSIQLSYGRMIITKYNKTRPKNKIHFSEAVPSYPLRRVPDGVGGNVKVADKEKGEKRNGGVVLYDEGENDNGGKVEG